MSISVTFNGVVYTIPQNGEESWGDNLTNYFVAIPSGALQKTGGSFTLTADANFGANFGLLSKYFSTRTSSPATTGLVRLAVSDTICWRNNANSNNLSLAVNGSDQLTFGGTVIYPGGITSITGDITTSGSPTATATLSDSVVTNAKVSSSAAIALSKLATVATSSILGRTTSGTGAIEVLTGAQATAILSPFTGDSGSGGVQGLVPAPSAGDAAAGKVLGADGNWNPPGTASPLTTKGDLYGYSSTNARIPVGVNGQSIIADSNQTLGVRYQDRFPKNYILNADAQVGTEGWSTYSDSASNIPTDGTGGTATGLTFSRTTSTPLNGVASFSIAQANSTSLQGKGVSFDFSIDTADQAQPIAIQFNYNASSTFVASDGTTAPLNDGTTSTNAGNSDIEVFVYDVTNSQLIYVTPQVIVGKGSNYFQFKGTFQSSANSTSYRLIFHVATSSANATGWTFKYDQVFVGRIPVNYGPPVSDWTSYTPTGSWNTNVTYTGRWRRVGDSAQINVIISTSGTTNSASLTVNLPAGLSIDTTKMVTTGTLSSNLGYGTFSNISDDWGGIYVGYNSSTSVAVAYWASLVSSTLTGNLRAVTQSAPAATSSTPTISITFTVPIVGWSSNVVMSNDTDTRVISARYTTSTQSVPNNSVTQVVLTVNSFDTSGSYNGTTYTAPVSGKYRYSFCIPFAGFSAGSTFTVYAIVKKNGSDYQEYRNTCFSGSADEWNVRASDEISLIAGDLVTWHIYQNSGSTQALQGPKAFIAIDRLSGPASIAATTTIAAMYYVSGTSSCSPSAPINFDTRSFDTTNSVTTGSAWKFTAPISGYYTVTSDTYSGSGTAYSPRVYKNGSNTGFYLGTATSTARSNGSVLVQLNAGDYVEIRPDSSQTITANSAFSIQRIG